MIITLEILALAVTARSPFNRKQENTKLVIARAQLLPLCVHVRVDDRQSQGTQHGEHHQFMK